MVLLSHEIESTPLQVEMKSCNILYFIAFSCKVSVECADQERKMESPVGAQWIAGQTSGGLSA
jgi:hypothetical protein